MRKLRSMVETSWSNSRKLEGLIFQSKDWNRFWSQMVEELSSRKSVNGRKFGTKVWKRKFKSFESKVGILFQIESSCFDYCCLLRLFMCFLHLERFRKKKKKKFFISGPYTYSKLTKFSARFRIFCKWNENWEGVDSFTCLVLKVSK